ncbi:MAG: hypothetical protein ACYCU5_09490 [Actinomycetes bacterium]
MQQGEQHSQAQPFEDMPEPEQQDQEQHLKTIAVRVEEGLHAQLRFIAHLNGSSITEEIRRAIENRIATAQDDPDLVARAQQVHEEIEREAAARAAAIAGFLGKPAVSAAANQSTGPAPKLRRSRTTNE